MAKVKAVEFGLDLAKRMNIPRLQVQMDNQVAVLALKNNDMYGGACIHIINRCWKLIEDSNWIVDIKHCYREGNRVADWLANQGVLQNNKVKFIQAPPPSLNLGRILFEDVVGVALPRFIPP